jgi:hypothetical protein
MLLEQLLNVSRDDSAIAGKVFRHAEIGESITEATAKVLRFNYERAKTDPKPRVLVLGRWLHPKTSNKLVAGLNLNYLNDDETGQLNHYLPQIMKPNSLKVRWWTGYGLLPQIWLKAYRQYDERFIHSMGQADIEPAAKDYESPKQPGEPQDDEKMSPKAAAKIQKLKKLKAQQTEQPPHEPKKKGLARLSKDTIKRLYALLKKKLFKNKKKELAKAEIEPEVEPEIIEPEEGEVEPEEEEVQSLKDIEDKHRANEDVLHNLDTLIEATVEDRKLTWHSKANYIHWHNPEKFTEYQPKLRGCVLDYAQGTKLIAIYDIVEDKLIIDLANSPQVLLAESGWDWDTTIRVIVDDTGLNVDYDMLVGEEIFAERVEKHNFWDVIQEVAADFQ